MKVQIVSLVCLTVLRSTESRVYDPVYDGYEMYSGPGHPEGAPHPKFNGVIDVQWTGQKCGMDELDNNKLYDRTLNLDSCNDYCPQWKKLWNKGWTHGRCETNSGYGECKCYQMHRKSGSPIIVSDGTVSRNFEEHWTGKKCGMDELDKNKLYDRTLNLDTCLDYCIQWKNKEWSHGSCETNNGYGECKCLYF